MIFKYYLNVYQQENNFHFLHRKPFFEKFSEEKNLVSFFFQQKFPFHELFLKN
jgi:hypothetical protein